MSLDPSKIPSGLSWGTRGFRIGKSASGNWWLSIGLPFGFRYTWRVGRSRTAKPVNTPEVIVVDKSADIFLEDTTAIDKHSKMKSYSKIKPRA